MGHCLIAALCSIHFSIMCLFMHSFTTLLSQLLTEVSCHNAVSYYAGNTTWEHHALASALLTGAQEAKDHHCPRQELFEGLCKSFASSMYIYTLAQQISALRFWLMPCTTSGGPPQILLLAGAKCSLILRGFCWTGNVHKRNVRGRIAGFGTAGTAVATCKAQGDGLELSLLFGRRNLKLKEPLWICLSSLYSKFLRAWTISYSWKLPSSAGQQWTKKSHIYFIYN